MRNNIAFLLFLILPAIGFLLSFFSSKRRGPSQEREGFLLTAKNLSEIIEVGG